MAPASHHLYTIRKADHLLRLLGGKYLPRPPPSFRMSKQCLIFQVLHANTLIIPRHPAQHLRTDQASFSIYKRATSNLVSIVPFFPTPIIVTSSSLLPSSLSFSPTSLRPSALSSHLFPLAVATTTGYLRSTTAFQTGWGAYQADETFGAHTSTLETERVILPVPKPYTWIV
ncbi:hypothetical protein ONZ45_g13015 [Pleurotus djamor]|nr:hypothetical protein ONZ45_g16975 [Pleurotus djamor]KAJ8495043.1 hypothetical protein ONZ45_g13015 [Pleurotus djamor]